MRTASAQHETDTMEMPRLCDCGQWFDLHDGHGSLRPGSNTNVCSSCYQEEQGREKEIDRINDEIERLEELGRPNRTAKQLAKLRDTLSKIDW